MVDLTLGERSIEVLLTAMHTAACLNVLALNGTPVLLLPSSQLMPCMGCNVEMWGLLANGQHCAINHWSDSFSQSL